MKRIINKMEGQAGGFTLVELIIVLLLVAVISALAGLGIVTGLKGYVFAKENASITQKAQLTMSRLSRELLESADITVANAGAATFQYLDGYRSLGIVGTGTNKEIKIVDGATSSLLPPDDTRGDVLINNVNSFTITYYKTAGTPWVLGADDATLLTQIKIDLVLNHPDSSIGTISFSTVVNPRNTGTYNVPVKL